ncbi:PepSY domain-containing protein [Halosquirtibacter laminarini]|uniref:PepSY domain-containing protein n=1 Tax=Halosquirtibacter laminarini TaxID=3374600 RepID=A0AC61NQA4_9BACT|nr:PepSY domain-containing protein [Prolixibacteraceae bacterium]
MKNRSKKLHRWPGLVMAFFFIYYGVSGILLNHRNTISSVDVSRKLLPSSFRYNHWNNAALKGDLRVNKDSILVYGNIGVWVTDHEHRNYRPINNGFPDGVDNRKVNDILRLPNGNLYAATRSGLYCWDVKRRKWDKFKMSTDAPRFVGLTHVGDTLYAANRSNLYRAFSPVIGSSFEEIVLPAPVGYLKKVSLFRTVWQLHSGEIFGLPGKLFIDFLALILMLLSVTGIFYLFLPKWIRKKRQKGKKLNRSVGLFKWSVRKHHKVGIWSFIFVAFLTFTGMFLRPPLILAIASGEVSPIPYSHLDKKNSWDDKLRDIQYDRLRDRMMVATSDGIYRVDLWDAPLHKFAIQPPVSVMGITVFEPQWDGSFLIGSFQGLYRWNPEIFQILDAMTGEPYKDSGSGRPVGSHVVTGLIHGETGERFVVDYFKGVRESNLGHRFPAMPSSVKEVSPMSLWSVALEVHTGRIFRDLLGDFYILIVPLSGIVGLLVVFSGLTLWLRRYRKRKKNA